MDIFIAFLGILIIHWIADFVLQTDWMATNKSKNQKALLAHVCVYGFVLLIGTGIIGHYLSFNWQQIFLFIWVNIGFHYITDLLTSQWTSYLWQKGDRHNFFVVIGLDQLIHQITLAITLILVL